MRNKRVWERACGLQRTVVEDVDFDDAAEAVVVSVRPNAKARGRCGRCCRRSPRYDHGEGRRRWRALDLGTTKVFLEADAPRVRCRTHGPTVAAVPWARHGAGHTRDFDDLAAWLAVRTSKSAVCQLLRVAWRTVGSIVTRVNADVDAVVDRLDGLRRIGIDEISYKRGHRYLIVVVDHDTGRAGVGRPGPQRRRPDVFFDQLGPERAALLTHVSADMADWIARVVAKPGPERGALRRSVPRRRLGHRRPRRRTPPSLERRRRPAPHRDRVPATPAPPAPRARSKRARYALWKNPETSPTGNATSSTGSPRPTRLWRAYLLKEGLRYVFAVRGDEGKEALDRWIIWARRSRSPRSSTSTARSPPTAPPSTPPSTHGLSNALVESTNTKIRLLTRIAFGFHGHQPLIALALLALGSHPPRLPGR